MVMRRKFSIVLFYIEADYELSPYLSSITRALNSLLKRILSFLTSIEAALRVLAVSCLITCAHDSPSTTTATCNCVLQRRTTAKFSCNLGFICELKHKFSLKTTYLAQVGI